LDEGSRVLLNKKIRDKIGNVKVIQSKKSGLGKTFYAQS
jgi:hypothetical protein